MCDFFIDEQINDDDNDIHKHHKNVMLRMTAMETT